ncbi:serine protease [Acinetobacter baumannii]|nr:serine protease [Acinetobacter baumannii]
MIEIQSVIENLLYSTIKITAIRDGVATGSGTGFFCRFVEKNDHFLPVLVTNKHVIRDADAIQLIFHLKDQKSVKGKGSGELYETIVPLQNIVVNHPDESIDLCAIRISQTLNLAEAIGKIIFISTVSMQNLPDDSDWDYFSDIEEVTMIGYPSGLSDSVNNFPLVRRGITATSPRKAYNGKQEFLVDMACFPGSSGSPVFLFNTQNYFDQQGQRYVVAGLRLKLLGILYAGPQFTNTGQIILNQPPQFQVATMMHLGTCIRSKELKVLDSYLTSIFNL